MDLEIHILRQEIAIIRGTLEELRKDLDAAVLLNKPLRRTMSQDDSIGADDTFPKTKTT